MNLRWYQQEAVDAVWNYWCSGATGNPLVCLPCGAGKTHVIAGLIKRVIDKAPDKKVLVISPRRELVAQAYEKVAHYLPFTSIGIVSAGLNRKDFDAQVIVAGIQSVYRRAEEVGRQSLLIVDEAQWLPLEGDGMFLSLIRQLQEANPGLKVVGTTATPWRTSTGILTQGDGIFTDIVYEVGVKRLMDDGFLCRLVSKQPRTQANLSKVAVRAGEYVESEMETVFLKPDLIQATISEVEKYAQQRTSWLFFCAGKQHAHEVAKTLKQRGHTAEVILADTPTLFRDQHIKAFKERKLKCLVGCQVFTEGFDARCVDMVALLRGTKSPGLYAQMVGRGMRTEEGKQDALVLDFAGVIQEHGPIDCLKVTKRWNPKTGTVEDMLEKVPARVCPECQTLMHYHLQECPDCGYAFLDMMRINHQAEASTAPILSDGKPPTYEVEVMEMHYFRHLAKGKEIPVLRADHVLSMVENVPVRKVADWVCLDHHNTPFAHDRAVRWWLTRTKNQELGYPPSVAEGLGRVGELKTPKKIRIKPDGQYWRVAEVLEWKSESEISEEEKAVRELEEHFFKRGVNI